MFTFALGSLNALAQEGESTFLSFAILFIYAVWSFIFLRQSGLPVAAFGLTMTNFKPAIKLGLTASAIFILGMFVLKWVQITWQPEYYGTDLITLYQNESDVPLWIIALLYCTHAVMQEFVARGCIQGGLHQFVSGKWAPLTAIVLATMMYSLFHLMLDMKYALLTIIPSLMWGLLFFKQRNLLAVAISHILIGLVAIFILGIV